MAEAGMKCVGLGRSSGEYQGHAYDNVLIHCVYGHEKVTGSAVKQVKVKSTLFMDNPVKVGDVFDVNYDEWNRVKQIVKL